MVAECFAAAAEASVPACAFSGDECATLESHPLLDKLHLTYHEPLAAVADSVEDLLAGPATNKVLLYAENAKAIANEIRPRRVPIRV